MRFCGVENKTPGQNRHKKGENGLTPILKCSDRTISLRRQTRVESIRLLQFRLQIANPVLGVIINPLHTIKIAISSRPAALFILQIALQPFLSEATRRTVSVVAASSARE